MKNNKILLRIIIYSAALLAALWILKGKYQRIQALKLYQEGYAAEQSNQFDQAIELFTQAIELDPKHYVAYKARGNAYQGKEQYDLAIEQYQLSLKINPNHASTYYNQGLAYYWKAQTSKDGAADYAKAVASYSRAIELNPNYCAAYLNRGVIYVENKDPDRAIADYNKAISIKPFYKDAYINRGAAYLEKHDPEKAIADFQLVLQKNPNRDVQIRIYRGLAMAYILNEDTDAATKIVYTKWRPLDEKGADEFLETVLTSELQFLGHIYRKRDKELEKEPGSTFENKYTDVPDEAIETIGLQLKDIPHSPCTFNADDYLSKDKANRVHGKGKTILRKLQKAIQENRIEKIEWCSLGEDCQPHALNPMLTEKVYNLLGKASYGSGEISSPLCSYYYSGFNLRIGLNMKIEGEEENYQLELEDKALTFVYGEDIEQIIKGTGGYIRYTFFYTSPDYERIKAELDAYCTSQIKRVTPD